MGVGHSGFVLCSLEQRWWSGCVLVMRGSGFFFFFWVVIMVDFKMILLQIWMDLSCDHGG